VRRIDWYKVKQVFGGIDFQDYRKVYKGKLDDLVWWNSIDFPSGCIWNPNIFNIIRI